MSAGRSRSWGGALTAGLVAVLCVTGWLGWQSTDAQVAIESLWSLCSAP